MKTANVKIAVEKYKSGEVSLGKAAELASLSVGDMMMAREEQGVRSNLDTDDYLEGLENLRTVW